MDKNDVQYIAQNCLISAHDVSFQSVRNEFESFTEQQVVH